MNGGQRSARKRWHPTSSGLIGIISDGTSQYIGLRSGILCCEAGVKEWSQLVGTDGQSCMDCTVPHLLGTITHGKTQEILGLQEELSISVTG